MNSAEVASPLNFMIAVHFDGASLLFFVGKFAKEHGGDYIKVTGSGRGGSPHYKDENTDKNL